MHTPRRLAPQSADFGTTDYAWRYGATRFASTPGKPAKRLSPPGRGAAPMAMLVTWLAIRPGQTLDGGALRPINGSEHNRSLAYSYRYRIASSLRSTVHGRFLRRTRRPWASLLSHCQPLWQSSRRPCSPAVAEKPLRMASAPDVAGPLALSAQLIANSQNDT